MSVVFVCVNYCSDHDTFRFVEGVLAQTGRERVSVVVADNTPRADVGEQVVAMQSKDTAINWVVVPSNMGYFGSAQYALHQFLQNNPPPDWVIVSNVDLLFSDREFVRRLLDVEVRDDIGVIAPGIRSAATNRLQNPYMSHRPSPKRMHFYKWLTKSYLLASAYDFAARLKSLAILNRRDVLLEEESEPQDIYAPHGSCIVFGRNYFLRGGTLDYPCFLFGEETFVAETARRLGLRIVFVPGLRLIHSEHISTGKTRTRGMIAYAATAAAYCADTWFTTKRR